MVSCFCSKNVKYKDRDGKISCFMVVFYFSHCKSTRNFTQKSKRPFFHPCGIIPRPNAEHHSQISMLRTVQEHLRRQPTHRTLLNGRPLNIVKGLAVFLYTFLLPKKISNKAKRPNIFRQRHVVDIPLFLFIYII